MSIYGHLLNESSLMPVYSMDTLMNQLESIMNESYDFESILESTDIIVSESKVSDWLNTLKDKIVKAAKWVAEQFKKLVEKIGEIAAKVKNTIVSKIKSIKEKPGNKERLKKIKIDKIEPKAIEMKESAIFEADKFANIDDPDSDHNKGLDIDAIKKFLSDHSYFLLDVKSDRIVDLNMLPKIEKYADDVLNKLEKSEFSDKEDNNAVCHSFDNRKEQTLILDVAGYLYAYDKDYINNEIKSAYKPGYLDMIKEQAVASAYDASQSLYDLQKVLKSVSQSIDKIVEGIEKNFSAITKKISDIQINKADGDAVNMITNNKAYLSNAVTGIRITLSILSKDKEAITKNIAIISKVSSDATLVVRYLSSL